MNVTEALAALRRNPADPGAWEFIVTLVYKPMIGYVGSLLLTFRVAPGETAYDIVHDVLLTFQKRWPQSTTTIDSEATLLAYFKSSCKNLLIDRYRHERKGEELVDYLTLSFANAFPSQQDVYRAIFLGEIIDMLPKECASLLTSYVTEQLTPAEMAEREGVSPATFYSRWYRCLQRAQNIFLQKTGPLKRS
jgi:RNA polymerase sigma factor (sigma-70 family)